MKPALVLIAIGDRYEAYAEKAIQRWARFFDGPVLVFGEREARKLPNCPEHPGERACWLKLHLWDLLPEQIDAILYADLDIYPLSAPIPPAKALQGVDMAVVRDRWHDRVVADAAVSCAGIPPWRYFNAGLIYARRSARAAFDLAKGKFCQMPWWDQTAINHSAAACDLEIRFLPWACNAMDSTLQEPNLRHVHGSGTAWKLWETEHQRGDRCFPVTTCDHLDVIDSFLDMDHPYCTHREAIAAMCFHLGTDGGDHLEILEIGTFRGHSAFALAAACCEPRSVLSLDPDCPAHGHDQARIWHRGHAVDFVPLSYEAFRKQDPTSKFDAIFHDGQHGPETLGELMDCLSILRPGGSLYIHDAEQLGDALPVLISHPCVASWDVLHKDDQGRELMHVGVD